MAPNCSRHWTPPKKGSFVVNCAARTGHGFAGISAIARDCNGDVIAATIARKKYETKLHAQMQSIVAALELIKKLTVERGIVKKNQAITVQTHHKRALQMINGVSGGIYVDEEEDDDDASDDDDDCYGEDEYSVTLIGEAEVEAGLPQDVMDMVEEDKVCAGLGMPVTKKAAKLAAKKEAKKAAKSSVSIEAKSVGKSSHSGKGKNVVKPAASKVASDALTVKGTSGTKKGACSVVFEEASQVPKAEGSAALEEANQANTLELVQTVTEDSTASEKMIKGLTVEDFEDSIKNLVT